MTAEPYEDTDCWETDDGGCGVHDTFCGLASADWDAYLRRLATAWRDFNSTKPYDSPEAVSAYGNLFVLLDALPKEES